MYIWLLFGSLSYVCTRFWYMFTDIQNSATKSTFFTESFTMLTTLIWCSMGVYAHRLGFYVLSSPSMLNHVRFHSRSFLKINSSILIVLLIGVFCGINIAKFYSPNNYATRNCYANQLPNWFCQFWLGMAILYSIPAIFFNVLVFLVLLAVMRTHTIVLRRQIHDLEHDEKVVTRLVRLRSQHSAPYAFQLPEIDIQSVESDEELYNLESRNGLEEDMNGQELRSNDLAVPSSSNTSVIGDSSRIIEMPIISMSTRIHDLDMRRANEEEYKSLLLTAEEINYRYRVLYQRANTISLFFQRWVLGWLLFVVIWTVSYIIIWLHSEPREWEIGLLLLPIVVFWLLCSSYAEVNAESRRFHCSICPYGNDRLVLMRFITVNPIQVGIFQVGLSYTIMMSIFVAMGIALMSKIILDEVEKK